MSSQFVLFVGETTWRIGLTSDAAAHIQCLPGGAGISLEIRLKEAKELLITNGYKGQPVMLVIPSHWCLHATFHCKRTERNNRKLMAFRLEEHLPISAEDFVADYRLYDQDVTFGVCTETARLRELVAACESAGIPIQHIAPHGLLAAAQMSSQFADAGRFLIATDGDEGFEILELGKSGPKQWAWYAGQSANLNNELADWCPSPDDKPLYVLGALPPITGFPIGSSPKTLDGTTPDQAAALEAARILDGITSPWIDLRRDTLASSDRLASYRKPLVATAIAAAFFLLCVALAAYGLERRYQSVVRQQQAAQVQIFKRLFPDQQPPANLPSRLNTEQRRLALLNGQATEDASRALLSQSSALLSLRNVLANLPPDAPIQILELDIQPDLIRVDGKAASLLDADRLAATLRKSGTMEEVGSPKVETLKDGGVSFGFAAKPGKIVVQEVAHGKL